MKKIVISAILLAVLQCPLSTIICQTSSVKEDKYTLLTKPYNKRQLTLYKGQFQVYGGYKFALRNRSYDSEGEVIELKKNGNSSMLHNYSIELKYGVLNFLELGVATSYSKRGVRTESVTYGSTFGDLTLNELTEYKGIGDLLIFTSVRLPLEFTWFDFMINGGFYLPIAGHEPEKPSHTITLDVPSNTVTVDYHYNNKNGYGVPLYKVGAAAKATFSRFSAYADFAFLDPLKDGTSLRWDETMTDYIFSYTSQKYDYLPDREISGALSINYQANGWFNIHLLGRMMKTSNGWTEYWDNKRYKDPETTLLTLEPGYELQISPSLRLYQVAGFSLAGKSTDAPFYMITTFSYSIFPFGK